MLPGVTLHAAESVGKCEGMNPHTSKRTSTLEVGVPMDSWIFRKQLEGVKTQWIERAPYIIGKLLERRCLKWTCMTHLHIWNTSYGQKKGWESNWQFDSRPLKVRNDLDFLVWRWRATYCWKDLDKGYNFAWDPISIRGLHKKLWACKVAGILVVRISGLPLESPETKCHLDVGLVKKHRIYYKREGDGFPQVRAVVSLLSPSLLVACPNTKSVSTMH
jgi:hypothetical protein